MDQNFTLEIDRLSDRQRQCLELVAQGYTSKEIARTLGLSPSTVDNHVRSAIERLNVTGRMEASRLFRDRQRLESSQFSEIGRRSHSLFGLPPLGGRVNDLSARRRMWHIMQIALIGIMGMTAAVITIAGLVNLFSRQ